MVRHSLGIEGRLVDDQPPDREQKQIHRIGQQGKAQHDLKGPAAQAEINAAGDQYPDGGGDEEF